MRHQFTAILERDEQRYAVYRLLPRGSRSERPRPHTRGLLQNLAEAVALILEDRLEDGLRGVPPDAIREVLTIA